MRPKKQKQVQVQSESQKTRIHQVTWDNQSKQVITRLNKEINMKNPYLTTKVSLKNIMKIATVLKSPDKTSWWNFKKNQATVASTEVQVLVGPKWLNTGGRISPSKSWVMLKNVPSSSKEPKEIPQNPNQNFLKFTRKLNVIALPILKK